MTTMAGPRKSVSIQDYPEHLNPFHEEDNHNKIRFWTIGRKLSRTNSITFSGIKDLKNSWSLRSFMRKGKKSEKPSATSQSSNTSHHVNGDESPVVFRRALQYASMSGARSTVGSPERGDRYVYGGSVTPLPRSRFQERLRASHQDVNTPNLTPRMARSDITGSRLSVESTNPFDECPVPPVRASRRKKKRAPPPPPTVETVEDTVGDEKLEIRITEVEEKKEQQPDVEEDIEDLKIELKIIEDEDIEDEDIKDDSTSVTSPISTNNLEPMSISSSTTDNQEKHNDNEKENGSTTDLVKNSESEADLLNKVAFPKVDITKYRRNSSVNEDDIRLRRGNLEDFHSLSNKRSKSLTNTVDGSYVAYDINLNESKHFDVNSNEEPQKVVCKLHEDPRKKSIDNSISSTEKEFFEIDKATKELEREISKLNTALIEDDVYLNSPRLSVSDIRRKFDRNESASPNPIPKPRRSHYGEPSSPVNGNG